MRTVPRCNARKLHATFTSTLDELEAAMRGEGYNAHLAVGRAVAYPGMASDLDDLARSMPNDEYRSCIAAWPELLTRTIDVTARCMQRFPGDMKLQKAGASVLSAIALDQRAAPVIAQRGGLAALVGALRANANPDAGAHDIEVHDACAKALNHFSGHSCCTAESRAAVEAAGVVHELLAILSSAYWAADHVYRYYGDYHLQDTAAAALAYLELHSPGVVPLDPALAAVRVALGGDARDKVARYVAVSCCSLLSALATTHPQQVAAIVPLLRTKHAPDDHRLTFGAAVEMVATGQLVPVQIADGSGALVPPHDD